MNTIITAPVCAFGYCREELYDRGCLEGFENMWICDECKFELQKLKEGEKEKTATPVIPAHQEEYISYIMKEIADNDERRTEIDLQIKKVDGLLVNVFLVLGVNADKTQLTFAHLKIMSSTICEVIDDDVENKQLFLRAYKVAEYGTDLKFQIANVLLDCKSALGTIKFVKRVGVYCSVKTPSTSFCEAYEIGEETGVVSVFQDCCVCYDKTITLTECKHSLCIPCWGATKYTQDDDGDENRLCPICREIIY